MGGIIGHWTRNRSPENVLDKLRPGAIILLHDGPDNAATALALPLILTEACGARLSVCPAARPKL